MNVAIAHDRWDIYGGAERVTTAIAQALDAPIYTMRNENVGPDDIEVKEVSGRVGKLCMRLGAHTRDLYQMLMWQYRPELWDYDLVIETKTNPYWYVSPENQKVMRYVHSTPRNLYDRFPKTGAGVVSPGMRTIQRTLFRQTLPYADMWVCNSDLVNRRMQKYYGFEADKVIYPPVDISNAMSKDVTSETYFLMLGRLAENKRVDLKADIAKRIDYDIIVAGEGPEKHKLEGLNNVECKGYVSESEKWYLLSNAMSVIFTAENEDFGIVPIEALASGTPVIAVNEGFTKYQIESGKTGYLCKPNVDSFVSAIHLLQTKGIEWNAEKMYEFSKAFSKDMFKAEIITLADRLVNEDLEAGLYE